MSPRITQTTKLQSIAKPGLGCAGAVDGGKVVCVQTVMANDHRLGVGQHQERVALGRSLKCVLASVIPSKTTCLSVQLCKRIVKGGKPQTAVMVARLPYTAVCERTELSVEPYLIGYARVSKGDEQSNVAQARALNAAGCKRLFEEAASGGRWDRPRLQEMIGQLRDGDVVVVWKLDRLSRSLKDLLHLMEKIEAAGAGFRSLTEAIDTTTPAGRMMMQMVGSFAEFERAMIRERTSAGLAQARLEGRVGGRRRKLDDKKRREIAESVISGRKSGAEMARLYDVSEPTVSRIVAEFRQQEAHEALE